MAVNPDMTASRAVDACGGTYTPADEASGYAEGHRAALDAAMAAVAKPDALMNELLEVARLASKLSAYQITGPLAELGIAADAAIAKATQGEWG